MRFRFRAWLSAVVAVPILSLALAQGSMDVDVHVDRCRPAFAEAVRSHDESSPEGRSAMASALLRIAFEALEPAYPIRRSGDEFDDPDAAWLRARDVLPASWTESSVHPDAWRTALARLQRPYGADPVDASGGDDPEALLADVVAALGQGASRVRPLPLLGVDGDDGDRVVFATIIWNWTPHARLLAFDLGGRALQDGDVTGLLPELGTCAWTPRSWVVAPAAAARGFYLSNVDTGVQVLAHASGTLASAWDVPAGEEEAVFRLDHPTLDGEPYASLGFTGPGPPLGTVLRLAVSIRTNLGVFDVGRYLAFP